jgi:DNA processing protein
MKNHSVILTLHELEGIGWKTISLLVRRYPELSDLLGACSEELQALGLPQSKVRIIQTRLTEAAVASAAARYEDSDIVPVTWADECYPELLRQTGQAPWVLYARGRIEKLYRPCIAIVGTRTPTAYGKRVAEVFGRDLSEAGVCVVSGLARGIDGCAHIGAIKGDGGTIAVIGCGIDVIYPREHAYLYREIAEKGLILSEYPPGLPAAPGLFPQRNRIIAGLSLGTLVVEAALRSGSLITADQALDESRDIFAIPGPINSPKSAGTNSWIQKGAKLVTNAFELLEEYKHLALPGVNGSAAQSANGVEVGKILSPEESRVLEILFEGPATIDELVERLQTNFGLLHAILLSLQMKKRIEQLPGSVYVII